MSRVLRPLGDLITTLPAGPDYPGRTAGPTFELFYENDYLMPHREAAWALLAERLDEGAGLCGQLQVGHDRAVASALDPVLAALRDMSRQLAAELPAGSAHARLAAAPDALDAAQLAGLRDRARELAGQAEGRGELADLFGAVHAIVLAADRYPAEQQALIVPRLVDSVLRPLAGELSGGAAADPPKDAGSVWAAARTATALRARLGGDCPPGLAEAVAALQDLAGRLASPAEARAQQDELWRLEAALAPELRIARNGPYLVTSVPRLTDHLGAETRPAPQLALCRCGRSALKPLCDGSHARTGFTDAKDPKRVPDQRDSYRGQQVTIFDNRGICQHSGLCTDRLATVFRTGAEPFVAPSGGRLDEIIRAVRDCPSGALSYALDDAEARAQVDWDGARPPAIEVTRDGPYRITGQITLAGATGEPEPQGAGASREHYALCRCGQSRNKPFCSGMHWYAGFRDPQPPRSPTLYEWAGGLAALTRMSRLLYEKHVPADPLLASRFAQMPAGQPQRLAAWLGGALGGPAPEASGGLRAVLGLDGGDFGEDQRARWVALAGTAAGEARLPADAGFRAALLSCLEWLSRTAPATDGAAGAPRCDWGPAGPPAPQAETPSTGGPADDALPGPGQPVGFAAHIKPLFRARDRQSMSFAFDLWSYDDVRAHAADIARRLHDGTMPCDGAWSAARIEVFQRWADTGLRP
jgi:CDGSH-type Zn-finger protein/truncated hemoglobin YjbI